MRGKPHSLRNFSKSFRITPAGAGKTRLPPFVIDTVKDHPRRCGENYCRCRSCKCEVGSPPQVRGKRRYTARVSECYRITPAGAGKTWADFRDKWISQDHPRRCGENMYETVERTLDEGSPPQVRGKLAVNACNSEITRITPAGAGKTFVYRYRFVGFQDHPRRCGENHYNSSLIVRESGSPPQVRGKRYCKSYLWQKRRITPAGAGKTH